MGGVDIFIESYRAYNIYERDICEVNTSMVSEFSHRKTDQILDVILKKKIKNCSSLYNNLFFLFFSAKKKYI